MTKVLRDPDGGFERLLGDLNRRLEALERRQAPTVTMSMELIGTVELAATGNVVFSDIPQDYTHLKIVGSAKGNRVTTIQSMWAYFNGDTAANYYYEYHQAASGTPSSGNAGPVAGALTALIPGTSAGATEFGALEITIPDYSNAARRKHVISVSGTINSVYYVRTAAALWASTAAITDIQLVTDAGVTTFVAGSVLSLYGLR